MALILRPALWTPSTESWLALPPLSASLRIVERRVVDIVEVPFASSGSPGLATLYNRRHGWTISFSARYRFSTAALGLAFQNQLADILIDSNGAAREGLTFAWWTDTAGTIARYYRDCVLSSPIERISDAPGSDRYREYRFELTSTDPREYASAPDGSTAPPGPYEYAVPGGEGAGEIPGVPEGIVVRYRTTLSAAFDGVVEITTASNVGSWQQVFALPGPAGANVTIRAIHIDRADNAAATGTSTVVVSTSHYAGAGLTIACSVNASQTASSRVEGELAMNAGDLCYVYWTAAGGHVDPKVSLEVEVG